jgi:hypothetical protein
VRLSLELGGADETKYLGLIFTEDSAWEAHVAHIRPKGRVALYQWLRSAPAPCTEWSPARRELQL